MKKSLQILLPAIFAFSIAGVQALEIDEKLTLRFLKISSTKKTVLINRGGEDGLVVGDHAKFFITAGVVARGVAEKVSPSRSVWSLYRIVDPNEIIQDKVLNLKIASPVKITDDPSRSLKEEVIPGGTDTIAIEPGTEGTATEDNDVKSINNADQEELNELGGMSSEEEEVASVKVVTPKNTKPIKTVGGSRSKNMSEVASSNENYSSPNTALSWEVWGSLAFNSLTGTSSKTDGSDSVSSAATNESLDLTGSVEKYFLTSKSFLKDMSFNLLIHKTTLETGETTTSSIDLFEYGIGANYHFYNPPGSVEKIIGFVNGSIGKGSVSKEEKTVSAIDGTLGTTTSKGDSSFYSIGGGAKYLFSGGFGIRGSVEYYNATQEYLFDDGTTTDTVKGPRIQLGVSYRF